MPLFPRLFSLTRYVTTHPFAVLILTVASLGIVGSGLKYLEDDADRQKLLKPNERSALARFNPFLAPPSPTPTPQLSKEYIYAGSRLLAVEDANANAAPPADLAVWRPSNNGTGNGYWYVMGGTGSAPATEWWGLSGDDPVEGDYDGDGKTDFSVFRPSDNKWYIMYSSTGGTWNGQFGLSGDIPAQADYDGDGKTDKAVFRQNDPTSGSATWYISLSSDGSTYSQQWGYTNDVPAPADYDGDGKADLAVWRSSNTNFYAVHSSDYSQNTIDFSTGGTDVVSSDYDGDGKADYAIFDSAASGGPVWRIRSSASGNPYTVSFGLAGDQPVQNDYDGDGKTDIAVWRSGTQAYWYIINSSTGNVRDEAWGITNDIPVPAFYRR